MLRLYDHPFSPYAQKVKISLREKGQAFEPPMPEGIGAGGTGGEFVEANPRAEVPAGGGNGVDHLGPHLVGELLQLFVRKSF